MTMEMSGHCPICEEMYVESSETTGRSTHYRCRRCGDFILTSTARAMLQVPLDDYPNGRILLSYSVRRMQGNTPPTLDHKTVKAILANSSLPSLREQENNIILYLGNNSNPGKTTIISRGHLIAVSGSVNHEGLGFIISHLKQSGLLNHSVLHSGDQSLRLEMKGWERFEEIRRGSIDSKQAFMAMPFGQSVLDEIYKHFKSAVAQTGFDLRRIDERPKAGLIDDRLRVEIRTSRFLIAELTESNPGAYWEAGFAEGLGKPVIYSCEKSYFEKEGSHFDTNHHLTVLWDANNIDKALDELKATIRATLPDEAKLQDDN